ncbi:MAG: class I SAM-dependent methyltransferase [Chloroflexota bacterium]|nr:class I SAM-dependent methyltransferase [Chloroflexota bacterium]
MPDTLSLEAQKILEIGYSKSDNPYTLNLRSKLTVLTYLRIAEEIKQQLPPNQTLRLLDWGTGAGQMSYLLARRGFDVTGYSYDESKTEDQSHSVSHTTYRFADLELPLVITNDPVTLPFQDGHFDAVLSCGVLEHVGDEIGSLREIRRVLKPGGLFFVYQLPQKGSWLEFILGRFKLGYVHERKYTLPGICQLLTAEGFTIRKVRRANMLPKNFTGFPARLKQIFEKQPTLVLKVDHALSSLPLLNQISGILELTASKPLS